MSKTVFIMRHAKSSWKDASLRDHDRPLNGRGLRDAPRMAQWLIEQGPPPQIILSSTALRARSTAQIVHAECNLEHDLLTYSELYLGQPQDYIQLLAALNNGIDTAMVVGHNHGLEDLVETLTGQYVTMPTAAIAQVDIDSDDWSAILTAHPGQLTHVWRPKEIG